MIRYAKKEDSEQINEIRWEVNDLHSAGRPDIFRSDHCQELADYAVKLLESDDADLIVAFRENTICGFACIEYKNKPVSPYGVARSYCEISELGVKKEFRRQKIATELFDFIKKEALQKGYEKLELNMWEFNEDALKFYESIGFSTYRRYLEYFIH